MILMWMNIIIWHSSTCKSGLNVIRQVCLNGVLFLKKEIWAAAYKKKMFFLFLQLSVSGFIKKW